MFRKNAVTNLLLFEFQEQRVLDKEIVEDSNVDTSIVLTTVSSDNIQEAEECRHHDTRRLW